ncbi:uncharacterized protein [Parasteatoda tepidariorum]|uniref:uncharacterized protein n=1 Tax=Parasteatoda tepidariorum TaxID=114398 RepID=UPI0039BCE97F
MASNEEVYTPSDRFGIEDCEALLNNIINGDYRSLDVKQELDLSSLDTKSIASSQSDSLYSTQQRNEAFKACASEEELLAFNQELQKKIKETISQLEKALEKNIAKQDELIESVKDCEKPSTSDGKMRRTKPISLFAAPYFRDVRGMIAPDNEDTNAKLTRKDVTAYLCPPRPWTKVDKDHLIEGVAANALNIVLKPYKTKRDYIKNKIKDKNLLEFEVEILKKQIIKLERKIREESQRPLAEILEDTKGKLDWMTISATNLQGNKTEEECEIMWNNYISYSVNKDAFSAVEDKKLKRLVDRYKARNWDAIAVELGTNRTAIQCLERYQTHLNEELTKRYWTPEEDKKLMELVDAFKVGNFIPWNHVCSHMEGRTRHQILNRYDRTISKEIKRTPFTPEEDAMILACVQKFGKQWTKMKEFLPGRSTYTIRERFVNTLDPALKIGAWTTAEDLRLIELLKKHGYGKWALISREMEGRTDNMCLVRARRLELHTKRIQKGKKKVRDEKGGIILKPNAPSKNCVTQNARLKGIQNSAMSALKSALEKIQHMVDEKIDFEKFGTSNLSMPSLRILQKELFSKISDKNDDEWVPKYVPECYQKSKTDSVCKKRKGVFELDDYVSTDEEKKPKKEPIDQDEELDGSEEDDDDILLNSTDRLWLYNVLQDRLREEANLMPSMMTSGPICMNARETAEYNFYRSFLRKKMHCEDTLESEVNEKPEYKETLSNVIRYFIQPEPDNPEQLPVLCPNFSTLSALEVMEVTKPRLRRTAGYINESRSYLKYLIGHSAEEPKCSKCRGPGRNANNEVLESVLKSMQTRHLVIDDSMHKAAEVEVGFPSDECCCEELVESRNAFNLLQQRFLSIFLWPSLLSSHPLTEEQEKLIGKTKAKKYTASSLKANGPFGVKRKRGRPPKIIVKVEENSLTEETEQQQESPELDEMELSGVKPPKKSRKSKSQKDPLVHKPRHYKEENAVSLRRSSRSCVLERKTSVDSEEDPDQESDT